MHDNILQKLDPKVIPACECLKDTVARVLPYWSDAIVPQLKVRTEDKCQFSKLYLSGMSLSYDLADFFCRVEILISQNHLDSFLFLK